MNRILGHEVVIKVRVRIDLGLLFFFLIETRSHPPSSESTAPSSYSHLTSEQIPGLTMVTVYRIRDVSVLPQSVSSRSKNASSSMPWVRRSERAAEAISLYS